MKRMVMLFAMLATLVVSADTWTDPVTGIEWTYYIFDGTVRIGNGEYKTAVPTSTAGTVEIPEKLGGFPVKYIGDWALTSHGGFKASAILRFRTGMARKHPVMTMSF